MKNMFQALTVALVLFVTCHHSAARSDDSDLDQTSSFHAVEDVIDETHENPFSARALQDARLINLRNEAQVFRNWLAQISHSTDGLDKRYKPSGFLGSRGKRFIPGLESLLLARYYKDAEKWKRQPHLGFHGSRG